jgi:hypothetical protein
MENTKIKPYLNLSLEDMDGEEWKDIIGYDGIYMISNLGRVKSMEREALICGGATRTVKERILKQAISLTKFNNNIEPTKTLAVKLCANSILAAFTVQYLVGLHFVGERKDNEVYSKKDKIWWNCSAENLKILSISDCHKLSYEKGNFIRANNMKTDTKTIYTRLIDNKEFTIDGLKKEYKKYNPLGNINNAIKMNWEFLGSKWSKRIDE